MKKTIFSALSLTINNFDFLKIFFACSIFFLGGRVYSSEEFIQCSLRVGFGDRNGCSTYKVEEAQAMKAISAFAGTSGATPANTAFGKASTVAKQQVQVVPTSDDFPAIDPTRPKKKK